MTGDSMMRPPVTIFCPVCQVERVLEERPVSAAPPMNPQAYIDLCCPVCHYLHDSIPIATPHQG